MTANEPLLPQSKRQKLNNNDTNNNDSEITQEDMEFLFQLKQQNNVSSLHASTNNTDINHVSYFATPSIANTNNSTALDALSTTATIHTNPSIHIEDINEYKQDKKDKAKEIYYRQIIQRSSRVGDKYQALILPTANSKDNDKYGGFLQNDDGKYGGSPIKIDSPDSVGNQLRDTRNKKRNELLDKMKKMNEDEQCNHNGNGNVNGYMNFNDINFDDDIDDDDDDDDEDFNMDEYNGNVNNINKRIMEGIMGRKSDWLPGDDGVPFDNNTRLQYLVKWKDSKEPVWEFADELEDGYQEQIDQFEDDEMEDMLEMDINDTINIEKNYEKNNEKVVHINNTADK
eukprot:34374_1